VVSPIRERQSVFYRAAHRRVDAPPVNRWDGRAERRIPVELAGATTWSRRAISFCTDRNEYEARVWGRITG
jgi:hypothetical protein